MSAPTNISFLTATDLGDLPATVTQRVDDAGTTYTVYYSFTAPSDGVVGVFAFGDLTTYIPDTLPYVGPASSPVQILSIQATNVPIQFPVQSGELYLLKILKNGGNPSPANLSLNVQMFANTTVPIGSFVVNDDTVGFPLGIASGTQDYTMLRFVLDFPAGEQGDSLLNGVVLVENIDTDTVDLYRPDPTDIYTLVTQVSLGGPTIRTCLTPNVFYVGNNGSPATFRTITSTGTVGTAKNLTGATVLNAVAALNDESVLYYAGSTNAAAVKRWNIPGDVALADLVAGLANYKVGDILVLGNNTILVGYYKDSATNDYQVLAYATNGTLLHTYPVGSYLSSKPRLAYALDDPTSFWVYQHSTGGNAGKGVFLNVNVATGATIATRTQANYEGGKYIAAATATPLARFGPSQSCPFWIFRSTVTDTETFPIRRQRWFLLPSSDDNKNMQIPIIEILMRTGIGLLPDSWTPDVTTPLGANPQVLIRLSKDGGKTWGPERSVSAGLIGQYKDRVRILRATGNYRNAVLEVTVADPVDWQFLAAMAPVGIIEGAS